MNPSEMTGGRYRHESICLFAYGFVTAEDEESLMVIADDGCGAKITRRRDISGDVNQFPAADGFSIAALERMMIQIERVQDVSGKGDNETVASLLRPSPYDETTVERRGDEGFPTRKLNRRRLRLVVGPVGVIT